MERIHIRVGWVLGWATGGVGECLWGRGGDGMVGWVELVALWVAILALGLIIETRVVVFRALGARGSWKKMWDRMREVMGL